MSITLPTLSLRRLLDHGRKAERVEAEVAAAMEKLAAYASTCKYNEARLADLIGITPGAALDGTVCEVISRCAAALKIVEAVRVLLDSGALTEKLAAIEHERWVDWMQYQEECLLSANANEYKMQWTRQVGTPYAELSEHEKASYRKEERRTLGALRIFLDACLRGEGPEGEKP